MTGREELLWDGVLWPMLRLAVLDTALPKKPTGFEDIKRLIMQDGDTEDSSLAGSFVR